MSPPSVPPHAPPPVGPFPPPGPFRSGSPASSVLPADSDPRFRGGRLLASPPAPLRLLRSAGPPLAPPLRSPRDERTPRGPGPFCAAPAPRLRRWRRRDLPGLGDPCTHAPLPDPGGAPAPDPFGTGVGVFRSTDGVDPARIYFRGSITRPARSLCTLRSRGHPRTTQHSVPAGASLGRSGLSPAGSHRRFPPCLSFYMPSPFTRLRLAQRLQKTLLMHVFSAQNTGSSGRNSVWLKLTSSEDKPHAPTVVFSPSFPRKRESRDFRD